MSDKEIWEKFVGVNPAWKEGEIKLTANQLQKIVLTACKYARGDGFEAGKKAAAELYKAMNRGTGQNGADIFKDIFGGFGKPK
jgi:hypothetical protein